MHCFGVSEDGAGSDEDVASMLKLETGARLEIKWDLVNDETNVTTARWWGCALGPAVGQHTLADEGDEGEDADPEARPSLLFICLTRAHPLLTLPVVAW